MTRPSRSIGDGDRARGLRNRRVGGASCGRDLGGRRRPVAAPRPHLDPWLLDLHLQRTETPVELGVGRVVAKKIVRRQVVRDALHPAVEVVAVDDRDAVGVAGQRPHDFDPLLQHGGVDGDRRRRIGTNRIVEGREPARIDRVEARVGGVRRIHEVEEELLVVLHAEAHAIGVALVLGQGALGEVARVPGRQLAVEADADRVDAGNRLLRAGERAVRSFISDWLLAIEQPALGDRQNGFALLADRAQVAHQILERLERRPLALARDQLFVDAPIVALVARGDSSCVRLLPVVPEDREACCPMASSVAGCPRRPASSGRARSARRPWRASSRRRGRPARGCGPSAESAAR